MKQSDIMYGMADWEHLESELSTVVDLVLSDHTGLSGEPFDSVADRMEWPIKVTEYKRSELPSAERIARQALDEVLEWLDQDFADPDGNPTDPSESLKQAAQAFGEAVRNDYVSYACEPTGRVIEVTREEAKRMFL